MFIIPTDKNEVTIKLNQFFCKIILQIVEEIF